MTDAKFHKTLTIAEALPTLYMADVSSDAAPAPKPVRDAHAIGGTPAMPGAVTGVARRATVCAASATAATSQQQTANAQQRQAGAARLAGAPSDVAVVSARPDGCNPETKGGVEVQNCRGVLYRSAFRGNNLVYVVQ